MGTAVICGVARIDGDALGGGDGHRFARPPVRGWRAAARAVVVCLFVASTAVGCGRGGSDGEVASHRPAAREAMRSDPRPVRPMGQYATWSRLARSGEVYLLGDNGFPANLLRFDGEEDTKPRVVNPPFPLFDVGITTVDGGFLVAGQDCTAAEDPQGSEPQCPGRPVALRYDVAADTWTLLNDDFGPRSARLRTYPGPEGSAVVAMFDRAGRVTLVVIDAKSGAARALPSPGDPPNESTGVGVCSMPGGLVAVTSPIVDAPVARSFAIALRFDEPKPRWSPPVTLPADVPPEVSGSSTCTDTGVALLGVAANGGPLALAPSASFDGVRWTLSDAPDVLYQPWIRPGPEGAVFGNALWRHDADGRWFDTETTLDGAVATVGAGDDKVVAASGGDEGPSSLRVKRVPVRRARR